MKNENFKTQLNKYLEKNNITKKEASKKIGCSYPTLFNYEKADYVTYISHIHRFMKAFDCDFLDLFPFPEEEK